MKHCCYCKKIIWAWQDEYIHTKDYAHRKCDLIEWKKGTQVLVSLEKMTITQKKYYDIMREAISYI